jgi:hypothetical protein
MAELFRDSLTTAKEHATQLMNEAIQAQANSNRIQESTRTIPSTPELVAKAGRALHASLKATELAVDAAKRAAIFVRRATGKPELKNAGEAHAEKTEFKDRIKNGAIEVILSEKAGYVPPTYGYDGMRISIDASSVPRVRYGPDGRRETEFARPNWSVGRDEAVGEVPLYGPNGRRLNGTPHYGTAHLRRVEAEVVRPDSVPGAYETEISEFLARSKESRAAPGGAEAGVDEFLSKVRASRAEAPGGEAGVDEYEAYLDPKIAEIFARAKAYRAREASRHEESNPRLSAIAEFSKRYKCDNPMFGTLPPRELIRLCTPSVSNDNIHGLYESTPGAQMIGEQTTLDTVIRSSGIPIVDVPEDGSTTAYIIKGWLHERTGLRLPPVLYLNAETGADEPITDEVIDSQFNNFCTRGALVYARDFNKWQSLVSLFQLMPPLWRALMCEQSLPSTINYAERGDSVSKSCASGFVERIVLAISSSGLELFSCIGEPTTLSAPAKQAFLISLMDRLTTQIDASHPGARRTVNAELFRPLIEAEIRLRKTENNPDEWREAIDAMIATIRLGGDYKGGRKTKYIRKLKMLIKEKNKNRKKTCKNRKKTCKNRKKTCKNRKKTCKYARS